MKQKTSNVFQWIWTTFLLAIAWILCILYGGAIIAFVVGLVIMIALLAYAGKAIALVIVLVFACAIISFILYQDFTLFTIISNYLSQFI